MNTPNWINLDKWWLSNYDQRTDGWYKARVGRLTGSNFGAAIGLCSFNCPQSLADELCNIKKRERLAYENEVMDWGTKYEDNARKWWNVW